MILNSIIVSNDQQVPVTSARVKSSHSLVRVSTGSGRNSNAVIVYLFCSVVFMLHFLGSCEHYITPCSSYSCIDVRFLTCY